MEEEKEVSFIKVHPSEYKDDVENQLELIMQKIPKMPKNTILYQRSDPPTFKTEIARKEWEKEEIRRCKYGHNGMCGKMYFWFNYCFLQNITQGKIRPDYRVSDSLWFDELESARDSKEWGVICVKRRRAGFSWKAASDAVHDAIFYKFAHVAMNSRTQIDSEVLFDKVKFIFANLLNFMKPKVGRSTVDEFQFFRKIKDEDGHVKITGNQSEIYCKAPTVSAFEGRMIGKWICDEAGKIPVLPQMWNFTVDTMMEETVRAGIPVIFGTVGEIDRAGAGIMKLWDNSDTYRLRRFFFAGYMGMYYDQYGNDYVEDVVRWILYKRKELEKLGGKDYSDFLQKYPILIEEAFNMTSGEGLGDAIAINRHIGGLRQDPAEQETGYMRWAAEEEITKDGVPVVFVPSQNGKIVVYERPNPEERYVSSVDPADHDDVTNESSDLSFHIGKKANKLSPPKIVIEYVDRPKKLAMYYEQTIMLNLWYNCKMLVENNRYRIISEYDQLGFKYMLYRTPTGVTRRFSQRSNSIGVRMTAPVKEYGEGLIEDYLDYHLEDIPSIELCKEFLWYGEKNTDRVMSFMILMILLAEEKGIKRGREGSSGVSNSNILPNYSYKKVGTKIVRVNN